LQQFWPRLHRLFCPPSLRRKIAPTARGQLDEAYCDVNNDLVADIPAKTRDPGVIVFAYTPVEDPAVYENAFKPFTEYLGKCTDKRVVYYPVQSNSAEIEAMRSGRLTVAGFSTGPVGFAVNMAGAIPFAAKGTEKGLEGYYLIVIVKKSSPFQKLRDLKGKKFAHTAPSSNSGNLAPKALFPEQGLKPGERQHAAEMGQWIADCNHHPTMSVCKDAVELIQGMGKKNPLNCVGG
jgi:phosphonate transport system substrate-binding protein